MKSLYLDKLIETNIIIKHREGTISYYARNKGKNNE